MLKRTSRSWISFWFMFTAPLMLWDAGYCLMRPRSMAGGDLHWLWKFYDIYGQVDHVYGVKAYEDGEGFANAAALMNVLENSAAIAYLYFVHVKPSPLASLAGYTGATMTFAKTCLYVAQEYYCGLCAIGHNTRLSMIFLWIAPNIVWLTFSISIMYTLGKDMVKPLYVRSKMVHGNGYKVE
ncbi:hypothetical protein Moror_12313 [Moniliophthora roreri MCA 2997]|uniref:EXPERA domain-containing protein n=2 Tax=Moniliophthora roreri TaxID=221103 RepID=V2XTN4_MONRO|nr:hypothetical protein Moror_12313 [Moniliophthora roreri MCA 2997]KAI3615983.1 hypothetical protein WG66_010270 [Moniliophthora roreri]